VFGVGYASSIIADDAFPVPGYLFDRSLGTPNNTYGPRVFENLRFANSTTIGGLGAG
jgi:hypothetical protein